jgi:hypothetical protein
MALDKLTTVGVEDAHIAVLVAEVQTHRHRRLLGATIIHGLILLSGPLEPEVICSPTDRVLREDWPFSSHLVWYTDRKGRMIDFWVTFSEVVIIVRRLIREGWSRYRWEGRPSRRP